MYDLKTNKCFKYAMYEFHVIYGYETETDSFCSLSKIAIKFFLTKRMHHVSCNIELYVRIKSFYNSGYRLPDYELVLE